MLTLRSEAAAPDPRAPLPTGWRTPNVRLAAEKGSRGERLPDSATRVAGTWRRSATARIDPLAIGRTLAS